MADVRCYDDLDPFGEEITNPLEELAQDNYHRIITPRGRNVDDPNLGLGIPEMLSGVRDGSIRGRAEAELLKDERNVSVEATVTELETGPKGTSVQLDFTIETNDGVLTSTVVVAGGTG